MNKYVLLSCILLLVCWQAGRVLADSDSSGDSDSGSSNKSEENHISHGRKHKNKHNNPAYPTYPGFPQPYGGQPYLYNMNPYNQQPYQMPYNQYPQPYPYPMPPQAYGQYMPATPQIGSAVPPYAEQQQPQQAPASSVINHSLKVNKEYKEDFST